tara:strand:- start:4009 stop:4407 length:399 start_codon:yes stop_codon:yes gene_type:complete
MRYTLKEVYNQAITDTNSTINKMGRGVFVISLGVKLQHFPSKTEILNCSKGGDYYRELDDQEYEFFFEFGWKKGVLLIALSNCNYKLQLIEDRMKTEMNTRKNDKHIQNLKTRRDNVLKKYAKYKIKLNQLN